MPPSWLPEGKTLGPRLYQMTRDGLPWKGDPTNFHKKCDNKGATLVAVKDTKGNVFGGCLTQPWTGSGHDKTDNTAWLFTLKNAAKVGPTKLPFKKDSGYSSHLDDSDCGPEFFRGIYIGLDDATFKIWDDQSYFKNIWQTPPAQEGKHWITGAWDYTPAEIEVYQVV